MDAAEEVALPDMIDCLRAIRPSNHMGLDSPKAVTDREVLRGMDYLELAAVLIISLDYAVTKSADIYLPGVLQKPVPIPGHEVVGIFLLNALLII